MIRYAAHVVLLLLVASPALAQTDEKDFDLTLQEAYKKEFAFLVGQQRQLETRLKSIDERNAREQQKLQKEIAGLENRLISVDGLLQDARETLLEVERSAESSTEDEQLIRATLEQATTSLQDYDVNIEVPEEDALLAPKTKEVFNAASSTLQKLSSVRKNSGEFFLEDGRKVTGDIVFLGRIAAFGVSSDGAGALAPAGGGKLKVWKDDASAAAKALSADTSPETLSLFLYESLDAAVEDDVEQSALEHVAAGGAIAWVIVALGVLGLLLAFARAAILFTCRGSAEELEDKLAGPARRSDIEGVLNEAGKIGGSAARVTSSVFRSIRDGSERLDEAISEGLIAEGRRLQLFGTAILVIAAVSPLLGLLGTVTGMISTFDVITKFGTGDPKMLSGGISTALITTELGLIVAIPTLLLGNLLKGWSDSIEAEAERGAIRMVSVYTGSPIEKATLSTPVPPVAAQPVPQAE